MKRKALLSIMLITWLGVNAQTNIDFETGDMTGWTCETGCATNVAAYPSYGGDGYNGPGPNCVGGWVNSGPVNNRHTVINASGVATCSGSALNLNPGGVGSKILKLGNEQVYSYAERVSNTFAVTENNCIVTLKYAVQLQDGPLSTHQAADHGFFLFEVLDQSNAVVSCPSPTKVVSSNNYEAQFVYPASYSSGVPPCWAIFHKAWTTVTLDLSGYVGQNITFRFTTEDCAVGGDATIAYIDIATAALPTTASAALCNAGTVTLTAPAGSGYNWLVGGQTTQSITAGASATTYSVTYNDGSGCPKRAKYSVSEPTAVTGNATLVSNVLCNAGSTGSASVNSSGGTGAHTYTWSPGGATGSSLNNVAQGVYTVTIRDQNNCTTTSQVQINEPTAMNVTGGSTPTTCNGQATGTASVNVTGGTAGYTYTWMPGNLTGASQTGLGATTYSITIYDGNNCTATYSVTVTQPSTLSATGTGASVNCFGDATATVSVSPSGGTTPYTYSWTNGPQTATYSNVGAGTYNVTVTDSSGCASTTSATVTGPSSYPVVTASVGNNVTCNNANDATATAVGTGGTGTISYTWTPGGMTGSGASNTQNNLQPNTYTVTIADANGCQNDTTITITEPQPLSVTASTTSDAKCNGSQDGVASVTNVTGGTATYTYSWNPGNNNTSSSNSLGAGTYVITITDANGCDTTASVTITEPTQLLASASATDVNCNGESTGSVSTSVPTTGTAPYSYSWNTNDNTTSVDSLPAGTYVITITDANSCTATATATIGQPQVFTASATDTDVTCAGQNNGTATASTNGGNTGTMTYVWTPGNYTTANIDSLSPNTYAVLVTDSKGCTSTATIVITEPPALTAANGSTTICEDQNATVSLSASGGNSSNYSYTWQPGNLVGSSVMVSPDSTTVYSVVINDGCSAPYTATFTVTVNTKPDADFNASPLSAYSEDQIIFTDISTDLNNPSWSWSFSDGSTATGSQVSHSYVASGSFPVTLIVVNSNGCSDTITKTVEIKEKLYVPNVFTPNGDGANDGFIISSSGIKDYKITIYDRWGLKMFESSDAKIHWDGNTLSGKPAPDATYYYILQATFYSENKEDLKGYLQLIRGQ